MLILGKLEQCGGVADSGEVGVLLPALEGLKNAGAVLGWGGIEELGPGDQFGVQPFEGLTAKLGFRRDVGGGLIAAQTGASQGRGAGGAVGVRGFAVALERGVACQRLRTRARRRRRIACGRRPSGPGSGARRYLSACHRPESWLETAVTGPVRARPERPIAPELWANRPCGSRARCPSCTSPEPRHSRLAV